MHAWGQTTLNDAQQRAFRELETLLASGAVRQPICLTGDYGSGKTTLAQHWLAQHFEEPEPHYCRMNRPLLDEMKRESDLDDLAATPQKARLIAQIAATDLIEARLADADAIVFDSIELLVTYRVPLPSLLTPHARAGKVIVVCAPDDPTWKTRLERIDSECRRIALDAA
ncbi:MAG: ATP-binding protein [Candidatus Poribacteria bacterium]|nr:ATP-binding protein [Candidatus Poribacteria bacterium]